MNIFNIKKSRLIYTILLVFLFFCQYETKASITSSESRVPQFLFFYKNNSTLLLPAYKDNNLQLKALNRLVEQYGTNIKEYYFSIISYVKREDAHNIAVLNMASLQGSVVREYILTHFRLPKEQFTFQIDTLGNENNRTSVKLQPQPLAEHLSIIHYSLGRNPGEIKKAMLRYRQIPYVNGIDNCKPNVEKQVNLPCMEMLMENVRKTDSLNQVVGQLNREMGTRQRRIDSIQHADSIFLYQSVSQFCEDSKIPFFALKTNLVYWAGFTPEMRWKQVLPNLALEFYPGKHWSFEFNGAYTNYLVNGNNMERYAFSAFGIEGRYWLRGNYHFDGFFGGIYVNGGEFDVTPKHLDEEGHTGQYIGAGLSLGYAYMFSNWFGLEIGARGGFRHVAYDNYYHEPPYYYYESTKYKNGMRLDGAFLNMIFRFEKYKK